MNMNNRSTKTRCQRCGTLISFMKNDEPPLYCGSCKHIAAYETAMGALKPNQAPQRIFSQVFDDMEIKNQDKMVFNQYAYQQKKAVSIEPDVEETEGSGGKNKLKKKKRKDKDESKGDN